MELEEGEGEEPTEGEARQPASVPTEEQAHSRRGEVGSGGEGEGGTPTAPPASTPTEEWGEPGSPERRQRVNDLIATGLLGGLETGFTMGGAVTVAQMLATSQATRMLAARGVSHAARAAGPVGAVIGGGVAVWALATKDWDQSRAVRARWNQGEGDELTANRLSAAAEWLDIIGNVVDVVVGLVGIAALACTALAFVTAGATAPAAAFLGKLALAGGVASIALGVIKTILMGLALYYRRKHLLETGLEDVDALEAQGQQLTTDAQGVGGFAGGLAGTGAAGGGRWASGKGAGRLRSWRSGRAATRGEVVPPAQPRDPPTVSARARQRLETMEAAGDTRAGKRLRGAERLDVELGGQLPPRPATPEGAPSRPQEPEGAPARPREPEGAAAPREPEGAPGRPREPEGGTPPREPDGSPGRPQTPEAPARSGAAPEALDPAARPPRSPDGRSADPPGRVPGDDAAPVPREPAGGPEATRPPRSPADAEARIRFIDDQCTREISFWRRCRDAATRGNDEGHARMIGDLDRAEAARIDLANRWEARQKQQARGRPDAEARIRDIEAEAGRRRQREREWAEQRRQESRDRHETRRRGIEERFREREADANRRADQAVEDARAAAGTQWPMAGVEPGQQLRVGFTEGGAPIYETGRRPGQAGPFAGMSDAQLSSAVDAAMGQMTAGERGGMTRADMGRREVTPRGGQRELFPTDRPHREALDPALLSTQQRQGLAPRGPAGPEQLHLPGMEPPARVPEAVPGWRDPLSPPGPAAFGHRGAVPGRYHGAMGRTGAGGRYHAAEVSFVTPSRPTYAVRVGPAGHYVDHVFNTRTEAIAYANRLAQLGPDQIRSLSALPHEWSPGTPGNPVRSVRVDEIPPNTMLLRSGIAPQPEGAAGSSHVFPGGGSQLQIPFGELGRDPTPVYTAPVRAPESPQLSLPFPEAPARGQPPPDGQLPLPGVEPRQLPDATRWGTTGRQVYGPGEHPVTVFLDRTVTGQTAGGALETYRRDGAMDWSRVLSSWPLAVNGVSSLVDLVPPEPSDAPAREAPPPAEAPQPSSSPSMSEMGDFPLPQPGAPVMATREEGAEVTEQVQPVYPEPPSSSLELEMMEIEIAQLEDAQRQGAEQREEAREEIEARNADEQRISQAKEGADRGAETAEDVGSNMTDRQNTHEEAQQQLDGAQEEAGRYNERSGELGTFTTLLRGVRRVASILTISVMPERAARAGRTIMGKASEIVEAIEGTNRDMRAQQAEAPQKQAVMDNRDQQISGTVEEAPRTQESFQQTSDDLQEMLDATTDRRSEAEEVAGGNQEAENTAAARIAQLKAQQAERMAAMEAWADEHRTARQQAIDETRQRLEEQDYDITSVTGDE